MTISSSLPGILRWFEVIHSATEEVPPIRFACETMETVNAELRLLISLYKSDPKRNINPLSMRLQVCRGILSTNLIFANISVILFLFYAFFQGTIDANVMGGISKYQQAFFSSEFIKNEPQSLPFVHQLHALILDQVALCIFVSPCTISAEILASFVSVI